jgi:hypothetical protein
LCLVRREEEKDFSGGEVQIYFFLTF